MKFCKFCRSRDAPLYLTAIVGWLFLSIASLFMVVHDAWEALEHEFEMHVEQDIEALRDRLRANEAVLSSVAAFVGAVGAPSERQLERYATQVLKDNPHIYMIEVMEYVPHAGREAFERRLRERLGPEHGIRRFDYDGARTWSRVPDKPHYFPITFIAPDSPEARPVLGLDMDSVPHLRAGVAEAQRRGTAVSSAPFRLVEGDMAYAMFQKAPTDPAQRTLPDGTVSTAFAMLIIKSASLAPAQFEPHSAHAVSVVQQDGPAATLFDVPAKIVPSALERRFFPRLARQTHDFSTSQPVRLQMSRQMGFGDISGWALAGVAALSLLSLASIVCYLWRHNEQAQAEDDAFRQAEHGALHDALTGLPNRRLFLDRLERAIGLWNRTREGFALYFIDLDHFKAINDRYGHDAGDIVLKAVAHRIESCTRETDTVARIAGDEFVVLLSDTNQPRHVHAVAQEVLAAIAHPVQVAPDCVIDVSASLGVSLCPDDGVTAAALLGCADRAMYLAKDGGRARVGYHRGGADECAQAAVAREETESSTPNRLVH